MTARAKTTGSEKSNGGAAMRSCGNPEEMAVQYNHAILEAAGDYLGLQEWPGAKHNPEIVAMFGDAGHDWVTDDETPWCAAFVASVLARLGIAGTGKLNARSYLDWGHQVSDAKPGDVVVLWRGDPAGWTGHVGFVVRLDGGKVWLRGGNQGNAVSDAAYPMSRVLGFRRYAGDRKVENRATLSVGSKGAFVRDAQGQLRDLGYFSGRIDGALGPRTQEAVLAFQSDQGLATDRVVGPKTWAALRSATPREKRHTSEIDLRNRGSATIAEADAGETEAKGAAIVTSLTGAAAMAQQVARTAQETQGALDTLLVIGASAWPALLLIAVGGGIWILARRRFAAIRQRRVEDARSGRNMGL